MGWFGQGQNSQGTLCPRVQHPRIFGRGHIGQGWTNIAPNWMGPLVLFGDYWTFFGGLLTSQICILLRYLFFPMGRLKMKDCT
jgi:hypothetical protein